MSRLVQRWWWVVLLITLAAGLTRVDFDPEILNLLPSSVPAVKGLQVYQQHFVNARELVITVRAPDADSAAAVARWVARALAAETNLCSGAVWQPPWLDHPEALAEFMAFVRRNQPPDRFAAFASDLAPERLSAVADQARERLANSLSPREVARIGYDPFGFANLDEAGAGDDLVASASEGFASADGRFRAVYVEARREMANAEECATWIKSIQTVVLRASPDGAGTQPVTICYTGAPAFVAEIAGGMARELRFSVMVTLVVVVGLFWRAHRSWQPLGWLVLVLGLTMAGALAAAGLIFGSLNSVSLGFGAILLGLTVDYGLVVYQEAAAHPDLTAAALRRAVAPALGWSAATTAAAFLLLNFAGLPGLAQLGTLVGIGVLLSPALTLFVFLPRVLPGIRKRFAGVAAGPQAQPSGADQHYHRIISLVTALAALIAVGVNGVSIEHSIRAIEPSGSAAQLALTELRSEIGRNGEPVLVVAAGRDEEEVAQRLQLLDRQLIEARSKGVELETRLPGLIWPQAAWQAANRPVAAALAERVDEFQEAAVRAGFTVEAIRLTKQVLAIWKRSADTQSALWPTNESCRWLLRRVTASTGKELLATGAIYSDTEPVAQLAEELDPHAPGIWLTGWAVLGENLVRHVETTLPWLVGAILMVLVACLRFAFGRWLEVILTLAGLAFALLVLQAAMSVAGYRWNLMSMAAVPLVLGAGVDYCIHVQMALRRNNGHAGVMRRVTGRALLLCATTTVVGFGSNAFSSNPGLASLSLTCALGLACAFVTALVVVPAWWALFSKPDSRPAERPGRLGRPSMTYGPKVWQLGLLAVRVLPRGCCKAAALIAAKVYCLFRWKRMRIIEGNLLPVVGESGATVRRTARALMANFAVKITDLMRHESGIPDPIVVTAWSGYEILKNAVDRKRGVIVVTPHLGNWELGGRLLAQKGVKLLVLTQAEPGQGFTAIRQRARARWGIETLVVGQDAFAFVEIIKRLQEGATVALLVDRPPAASAVEVAFFDRPFRASIAPAELARASGCAIVPVYVVAEGAGYAAHVLTEIKYDRPVLGSREARTQLAGEILRAFESPIRQHADQWYHFVPLWPWPGEIGQQRKDRVEW